MSIIVVSHAATIEGTADTFVPNGIRIVYHVPDGKSLPVQSTAAIIANGVPNVGIESLQPGDPISNQSLLDIDDDMFELLNDIAAQPDLTFFAGREFHADILCSTPSSCAKEDLIHTCDGLLRILQDEPNASEAHLLFCRKIKGTKPNYYRGMASIKGLNEPIVLLNEEGELESCEGLWESTYQDLDIHAHDLKKMIIKDPEAALQEFMNWPERSRKFLMASDYFVRAFMYAPQAYSLAENSRYLYAVYFYQVTANNADLRTKRILDQDPNLKRARHKAVAKANKYRSASPHRKAIMTEDLSDEDLAAIINLAQQLENGAIRIAD